MKTSVKVALISALIWIILVLVVNMAGYSRAFFTPSILINIFGLLISVSAGLFLTKKKNNYEKGIFVDDFKTAMQGGIVYALIISGFIYLYHSSIDPSIRESLVEARMDAIEEMYPNESSYKELQAQDPQWTNTDYEGFIEKQHDTTKSIISAFSVFIFHLMGLFIFSMFFSFFGTIIIRKVVLRQ